MRKKIFAGLLLLAMMLLSFGAGSTPALTQAAVAQPPPATTAALTPKSGGILRIGVSREATTLGRPEVGNVSFDGQVGLPAIEKLRRLDETDKGSGAFYPLLADKWSVDDKALTVTITLKKGIKFHDGTPLNAEALKWNFEWLMTNRATNVAKAKSVDIVDEYTVKINLKEWSSDVLYDLTGIHVVSPTAWKKNGDQWGKQNPVGTGPFKMASRQPDVNIKYVKNNDYWQKGKPYLNGIDIIIIKDSTTRHASLKAGEIDLELDPTFVQAREVKNDPKYVIVRGSASGGSFSLTGDGSNPDSPFSKLQVRQAVCYAIDRQALVDGVLGGFAGASIQHFPPGTWPNNPNLKGYTYDPDRAKRLLAEAGYPNGFETSLLGINGGIDPAVLTAIQAMLAKVNIKANLDLKAAPAWFQISKEGWKNGMQFGKLPTDPGYVSWLVGFSWRSTRQNTKVTLCHPEIDEWCDKATTAPIDLKIRQPIVWKLIETMSYKLAMQCPLFYLDGLLIKYPYVKDDFLYDFYLTSEWRPDSAWINR